MSFTDVNTAAPTGGSRYAAPNYILRVVKKACAEGTEPDQTEAILVKKGLVSKSHEEDFKLYVKNCMNKWMLN